MPYWIDDNGEKLGPMRAIDVLRRAKPTTRIFDGENWFTLDEGAATGDAPVSDSEMTDTGRIIIRRAS
jgi:hypothetical protein